jgi:hypothetical protein
MNLDRSSDDFAGQILVLEPQCNLLLSSRPDFLTS